MSAGAGLHIIVIRSADLFGLKTHRMKDTKFLPRDAIRQRTICYDRLCSSVSVRPAPAEDDGVVDQMSSSHV